MATKTRFCPKRSASSASLAALLVLLLWAAAVARAQDRVYWSTPFAKTLSFATLDGVVAGSFPLAGADPTRVGGLVVDSATQRIFWANSLPDQIAFTGLESNTGGLFDTGGVNRANPVGLAIDPVERRLYWSNTGASSISFADLDGSGGGPLNTAGAAGTITETLIFDQASDRVYWTNPNLFATGISFANLDGSGGGNLRVGTVQEATGLAIDHASNRIYWTTPGAIEYANLDGSGRAVLPTGPVQPTSIAVDHAGGRIYWGEFTAKTIAFSRLDGSGLGSLARGPATEVPRYLTLVVAPRASAPSAVGGGSKAGSLLTCSPATWSPDLPEASLYQAPVTVAIQWTRDGTDIPGATAPSLAAAEPGAYTCRATATNHAGSTVSTSAPHRVLATFGPRTRVTLTPTSSRAGRLAIRISNANPFPIKGTLNARGVRGVRFKVDPKARTTVRLRVRARSRALTLRAEVTDPAGDRRTVKKRISP